MLVNISHSRIQSPVQDTPTSSVQWKVLLRMYSGILSTTQNVMLRKRLGDNQRRNKHLQKRQAESCPSRRDEHLPQLRFTATSISTERKKPCRLPTTADPCRGGSSCLLIALFTNFKYKIVMCWFESTDACPAYEKKRPSSTIV